MGEPATRITTAVDVLPWIDRKRRAMQAHASQISEDSFFLSMPDDVFSLVWGREWYIQVRPEPEHSGPDALGARAAARAGCRCGHPTQARRRGHDIAGAGNGGAVMSASHRVLRVHGGRLVVDERRLELEQGLDQAAAEGFELVNSFTVDDSVYLVLRRPGA